MTKEMQEAVDFLYATPKFTTKNSLDHTRALMGLLGNPCASRKIIHVAGSNGKGSVCCMIYHSLLAAGKTVSLFTSPHLVDVRERFQVNGSLISEQEFMDAYYTVKAAADTMVAKQLNHPTFFEFIFAMGMVIFERRETEFVVLETGLGGRLDATNSFLAPILSVITSISLEHTEILGNTISLIAGEKAGIIKPGIPVIFDANERDAEEKIRSIAHEKGCHCTGISSELFRIDKIKNNSIDFSLFTDYDKKIEWQIPFSATYQVENAAVAITALRTLQIPDEVIQEGLMRSVWPGRMQEVKTDVFFDGAHNTSGISVFLSAVKELVKDDIHPPLLLFSMVKEKDYHTSVRMLTSEIEWGAMAVTTIPNERGIRYEELQEIFEQDTGRPVKGFADYKQAFQELCLMKKEGQKLFCTGSLYFVGALLEQVQQTL